MENIYTDTYLHFCETGEDIEPYEKSLQRTISIRLYQDEVEELCMKSGKILSNGLTGAISVLCLRKRFYLICLKCRR